MEQQNFINALFVRKNSTLKQYCNGEFRQFGCLKNQSNEEQTERHVRRVLERSQWKIGFKY